MKFYYQILTTPTADTPGTAVLLHFPDKRYIFGQVSEGTQRACTQHGAKITNLSDIFLTGRMEWQNTGGLIGMILTQADVVANSVSAVEAALRKKEANRRKQTGKQTEVEKKAQDAQDQEQRDLTVHGPRNLAHTLATARRFVFRKGMPVYTKEYEAESASKRLSTVASDPFEQPTWSDRHIKVWAMPISTLTASQPRPQSPRKRSLDEFRETSDRAEANQRSQNHIVRQAVVADMFNSNWELDALYETRLADVKMPAVMFVRNPVTKDLERYMGPAPGSNEPLPEMNVLVRKAWPGASVEKIPTTTKCDEALCYIIKNHDIRGKFDPKKAIELQVSRGPNFSRLTKGENVLSEDGKVVTPDMVLGPPRIGKGLAVIDLPTPDYVENLVNRPEWKSPSVSSNLQAFIWILGPGVGDHPRLQEFVASMPNSKHIVSSTDYCPNYLAMRSVASTAIQMARLRPENHPVPVHDNLRIPQTQSPLSHPTKRAPTNTNESPFEPAKPGLIIDMQPEFRLNRSEIEPPVNTARILQHIPVAAQERADTINTRLKKKEAQRQLRQFLKDLPGTDVEVITLGTGSSIPSKYRNVSSTLIHVPGQGYYLLDCGEGTLGQLKRIFNPQQLGEVLQNLRLIWISHLHADHHLGTVSVLKAWYQENYPDGVPQSEGIEKDMSKILQEKRLFLVSEIMMIEWLEEYAGVEDFGFAKMIPLSAYPYVGQGEIKTAFLYRHCRSDGSYPGRELPGGKPATTELLFTDEKSPLTPLLRKATGLSNLLTTYVSHCRGSLAVSLVFPDGFKASFSGDCRPSSSFAAIGKGSTILIHEATFQDDMAGSAIAKKHSTSAEAIGVGHKMRARSILLTHFSQRYQKIAPTEQSATESEGRHESQDTTPTQTTTDVPIDNEVEEEVALKKFIGSDMRSRSPPPAVVPIVVAYDYMRVRVGDMFATQAYNPSIEKLLEIMERGSAREAEIRAQQFEREKALKGKKNKDKKKGAVETTSPPAGDATPIEPPKGDIVSVWDAPESESGWSTSEYE